MSQPFFTAHARDRAKERYGIELKAHELWDIWKECAEERALLQRRSQGRLIFVLTYKGVQMVPVLANDKSLLVTFLPVEAVHSGGRLKHNRSKGLVKQRFAVAHGLSDRQYRREKIRLREIEDDQ